jgi:cytochrome P450
MLLYPEVQRKAQDQLDTVVGRDRLPTFEDLDSLPYIQATVKEMLRWQPVTPLGLSHYRSVAIAPLINSVLSYCTSRDG